MKKDGRDPESIPELKQIEEWIDSQQYTFLTEVTVGSWSGVDTRKMAEEADCLAFYRYVYSPFSPAVHSMWNHVAKCNLRICTNPLHGVHRVPIVWEIPQSIHYLELAVKYVGKAFRLFDKHIPTGAEDPALLEYLHKRIGEISSEIKAKKSDVTAEVGAKAEA